MEPAVTCLTYDGMASGVAIAGAVIAGLTTGLFKDLTIEWDLQIRQSTLR